MFGESPCATIKQWEDAGASLSVMLAHYLKLSKFLLESSLPGHNHPINLVTHIDSSLEQLYTTLNRQLAEARVALSKTRNRITSRIYSFPEEILSEIFMHAMYDYNDALERCPRMEIRVQEIYKRLHNLLGVCSTWRNVAINRQAFWSIIPVVDPEDGLGGARCYSTEVSLQRAGDQGLHLAISGCERGEDFLDQRLDALEGNFHRFRTININLESLRDVFSVLTNLLEESMPMKISHLSLSHWHQYGTSNPHSPQDYFNSASCHVLPQFHRLISSLSALRISNVPLHWRHILFSSRLVELRVHKIRLSNVSEFNSFMNAVSSASQLRCLILCELKAFLNRGTRANRQISLPKLQSLYLEDLHLNILVLILSLLSPGSYHSTLCIGEGTFQNLIGVSETEDVGLEDVCNALEPFPIHKLILGGIEAALTTGTGLHRLLASMLALNTLILNYFRLNEELLEALCPPRVPNTNFPKLHTIEFRAAKLLDDGEGFKAIVASHPIRSLVLGGVIVRESESNWPWMLYEHEQIVKWLKTNVPGFRFVHRHSAPESFDQHWQLWDV